MNPGEMFYDFDDIIHGSQCFDSCIIGLLKPRHHFLHHRFAQIQETLDHVSVDESFTILSFLVVV